MIDLYLSKQQLFDRGVDLAKKFLAVNNLYIPEFLTYQQVFAGDPTSRSYRILRKLENGPHQGYGTGYYSHNRVFVNLKKAAWLVRKPACSSWSFPGYKVDREPCGVVAHEVGHHVDKCLCDASRVGLWRHTVSISKPITSYEPNLSESFAETLRLFILNPDLLRRGSPQRFDFLVAGGLRPSENRDFIEVLDHIDYIRQAERWIAKKK